MSFLSRKPTRPDARGSGRGRADEYDDYDDYTPDDYADADDDGSPVEYFSPGGIKGRWAGDRSPAERSTASRSRGRRGDDGRAYDGYDDGYDGGGYVSNGYGASGHGANGHEAGGYEAGGYEAGGYGADTYERDSYSTAYGADEYATSAYELPEGADEERGSERGSRRRRRDREDRGERTGILRLRRDRGEDIWPDDGISDEDYWASVASDRPLGGINAPRDDDLPATTGRPATGLGGVSGGPGGRGPAGGGSVSGGPASGGVGRLGPAPGLLGDYQPGGSSAGPSPLPARSGNGQYPARNGTGPIPTVGAASSRPVGTTSSRPPGTVPARPGGDGRPGPWPGRGQPGGPSAAGSGSGSPSPQPGSRPSFQPAGYPSGATATGSRHQPDRGDWGERTDRIERVDPSGYPDPLTSDAYKPDPRSPDPRSPGAYGSASALGPSAGSSPARGRGDGADWRSQDRHPPSRDGARDLGLNSAAAPASGRGGAPPRAQADDDPLTSPAYSRSAAQHTDGRSYELAAQRSQVQPIQTDASSDALNGTGQYPAAQYGTGQYPAHQTGQYQTDQYPAGQYQPGQRAGEYPSATPAAGQYPAAHAGQRRADPHAQAGRYSGYSPQTDRGQRQLPGHTPGQGQQSLGPARGQNSASAERAAQSVRSSGRVSLPSGSQVTGQYETQPPRPQRPQPPSRPAAPQPLPPASAPGPAGLSSPAGPSSPPGAAPSRGAGSAAAGLNPYDSPVTGAYPYSAQPYPGGPAARLTDASPPDPADDDRYYRPTQPTGAPPATPPADGYGNPADHGRGGTGGYGTNGYGVPRDSRY